MKRMFFLCIAASIFCACNNNSSNAKVSPDSSGSGNTTGIENVNGNIPDTSQGIKLNKPLPKDSSRINDSVNH